MVVVVRIAKTKNPRDRIIITTITKALGRPRLQTIVTLLRKMTIGAGDANLVDAPGETRVRGHLSLTDKRFLHRTLSSPSDFDVGKCYNVTKTRIRT